jgi:hypothetical protein
MIIAAGLLICWSCKQDRLTKATQTGANTFSCKVDGKIFKAPEHLSLFGGKPVIVSNWPLDGFTLHASSTEDEFGIRRHILIQLPYLTATGSYALGKFPYSYYQMNYGGAPVYHTDATHTGSIQITRCDTVNQIYSGTFYFTGIDESSAAVVKVTDGRFDIKK